MEDFYNLLVIGFCGGLAVHSYYLHSLRKAKVWAQYVELIHKWIEFKVYSIFVRLVKA